MPIYEYYCPDCHMILNFFVRRLSSTKKPTCPHCKRRNLKREVSMFAMTHGGDSDADGGEMDDLPIDESKMERAIESLASEAEGINEDDPRAAAQLMRKFSHMTGLEFNEGMQEALQRMESGEDPEAIEAEMGDLMDDEDPFIMPDGGKPKKKADKRKRGAPRRDSTLYDL